MALSRFNQSRKYLPTLIHLPFGSAVLCIIRDAKPNIAILEKEGLLLLLAEFQQKQRASFPFHHKSSPTYIF